ncbi:MAG TPA: sigma-54 dependent transcriptional regulator [Synergistaceae bacterium]|nr:sigma-54 dependent transcriptional regulator [Synergistaceae bacterium]
MNIWIVEDEISLAQGLRMAFEKEEHDVRVASSLGDLRELLEKHTPQVVFLDIRLPDGDGLKSIPHILQHAPKCKIIVMTAFGESSLAVRAIKDGAYNYLDKPFPLEAARNMAARAGEIIDLDRRVARQKERSRLAFVGSSEAALRVHDFIDKVAPFENTTILLTGESGTGKEVAARLIHEKSGCSGEFIALNCAAVPESLLEAELFGHKKGAYTGASQDRQGLVEAAAGGTLFLDEIGDMPLPLQSKLLRFLDSRNIRPLGSTREKQISLRVICATWEDLETKVQEGSFRKDLYYRIAMLPMKIPPLRERSRDVLELFRHFSVQFSPRMGQHPLVLSPDVEELFLHYPWRGNVRELKNLVERLFILRNLPGRELRLGDLPEEMLEALPRKSGIPSEARQGSFAEQVGNFEKKLLREALEEAGGNRTRAAEILGLSRYALIRRLQRHAMD